VRSHPHDKVPASFTRPTAEDFARQACKVLGDGAREGCGCFSHAFQQSLLSLFPSFILEKIIGKTLQQLKDLEEKNS